MSGWLWLIIFVSVTGLALQYLSGSSTYSHAARTEATEWSRWRPKDQNAAGGQGNSVINHIILYIYIYVNQQVSNLSLYWTRLADTLWWIALHCKINDWWIVLIFMFSCYINPLLYQFRSRTKWPPPCRLRQNSCYVRLRRESWS